MYGEMTDVRGYGVIAAASGTGTGGHISEFPSSGSASSPPPHALPPIFIMSTNSYIVVFKDHATPEQINQYAGRVSSEGGEVGHRYDSVFKGFSAKLPDSLLQNFQGDDIIQYIG
ncbi:hypothetical protein FRC00_005518 [Tulasnella sp. 408]|nr:hypothetical protein FRC00_005518 [Tulasnella sp. 408]